MKKRPRARASSRTPVPLSDTVSEKMLGTIQDALRPGGIVREIGAKLTAVQKRKLQTLSKKLDVDFLIEKAVLIKDTMAEIATNRTSGTNRLLQRNVWSSVDAIALHLDHVGFTPVFQAVANTAFRKAPVDDPRIAAFEWQLLVDLVGGERRAQEFGLSFTEMTEVLRHAEEDKPKACGLPAINRRDFSLRRAFAHACGRPDRILEEIHPNPGVLKVLFIAFIFAVNFVAAAVGILAAIAGLLTGVGGVLGLPAGAAGVMVAVLTLVATVIVLKCGC